jgi:hypothetical protein
MTRIFNGHRAFGPQVHFQAHDGPIADLIFQMPAVRIVHAARVQHGGQLRPNVRDTATPCRAPDMREELGQALRGAREAGHRHSRTSFRELSQQPDIGDLPGPLI